LPIVFKKDRAHAKVLQPRGEQHFREGGQGNVFKT